MIEGVKVKQLVRHPDDRGFFEEILRADEGLLRKFGQASLSKTYPGVIKAFHYHEKQDDLWFFPVGNAQVVLYDRRPGSPTHGETDVFYMGEDNPLLLLIPVGVAHGYRTLGEKPALIVYFTTEPYNREAPDEHRIPYDDPAIGFDWRTKMR
ncbi:MAG: dTDP-4-dehydrorhamnose 3,5-epimerase family protein [Chloroflexi bacterium]|nr:dTDP-4-dehydrorhamnose 3,5-epimerase family protein [Chloroflexota bacterium]